MVGDASSPEAEGDVAVVLEVTGIERGRSTSMTHLLGLLTASPSPFFPILLHSSSSFLFSSMGCSILTSLNTQPWSIP